jgi:hypothetical protein
MITITKKVTYEFDYNHNLNNNFNTVQNLIKLTDQTRHKMNLEIVVATC